MSTRIRKETARDRTCPQCQRVLHTIKGAFGTHVKWCSADRHAMFWKLVDKRGPDECWPWKGGMKSKTDPKQMYGVYGIKRKQRNAHRVAYIFTHGDPGPGFDICHRCDNPICVNPAHLYAGTEQQNMLEAHIKRRHKRSAVTPEQVQAVRERLALGTPCTEIARELGLKHVSSVYGIKSGRSYLWVK